MKENTLSYSQGTKVGSKINVLVPSFGLNLFLVLEKQDFLHQTIAKKFVIFNTDGDNFGAKPANFQYPPTHTSNITVGPSVTKIAPNQPITLFSSLLNKIGNAVLSKHFRISQIAQECLHYTIEKMKGAGRDQVGKRITPMAKIRTIYCFSRPVPILILLNQIYSFTFSFGRSPAGRRSSRRIVQKYAARAL